MFVGNTAALLFFPMLNVWSAHRVHRKIVCTPGARARAYSQEEREIKKKIIKLIEENINEKVVRYMPCSFCLTFPTHHTMRVNAFMR